MKTRIITAVIGLLLFIPVVLVGGWSFTIVTYLLATIGLFELTRMYNEREHIFKVSLASLFLWLFLYAENTISVFSVDYTRFDLMIIFITMTLFLTVATKNKFTFEHAGFLLLSTLYLGI